MILVQYSRFTLFTRFSVICVWTHTFLDFSTLCCFNHLLLSSIILNYISCKHAWNACVIQICTQILHKKHAELFRGLKWFTIKSSIITHYFPFVQSRVFWQQANDSKPQSSRPIWAQLAEGKCAHIAPMHKTRWAGRSAGPDRAIGARA